MKTLSTNKIISLRRANCIEELESRIVFDGAIDVEPQTDVSVESASKAPDTMSRVSDHTDGHNEGNETLGDGTVHFWSEDWSGQNGGRYDHYWYTNDTQGWAYTGVELGSATKGWEYTGDSTGVWVYHGYDWSGSAGLGWEYAGNSNNEWYYETVYTGQNSSGVADGTGHWTGNYTGYQDFSYDFYGNTPTYYYSPLVGTDWNNTCWTQYWAKDYNGGTWSVNPVVSEPLGVVRITEVGGNPLQVTNVNGTLYFTSDDHTHGEELWRTDGTASGTRMVKDILPGSEGSMTRNLTDVNGTLFFTANDGVHGYELWKTDGTASGTQMIKDITATDSFGPQYLTNVNGTLFFMARDTHGAELWKSDGTAAGTQMVKDINTISESTSHDFFTEMNGKLYFMGNDHTHGGELWRSDGTENGTMMVRDINTGTGWGSAGYGSGLDGGVCNLTNVNGTLFFRAASSDANGGELWKTDGTTPGTVMVKDTYTGSDAIYNSHGPSNLTNVNGTLFFEAVDNTHFGELWKSDGTTAGTMLVKDINPASDGWSNLENLTNVNGTLFFTAQDGVHGYELWKSDGTTAGTTMVKDITPGANENGPAELINVNGTLYFRANDGIHGSELWKSDGTSAGTQLVSDTWAGSNGCDPSNLTNVNGTLYFTAHDSNYSSGLYRYRA